MHMSKDCRKTPEIVTLSIPSQASLLLSESTDVGSYAERSVAQARHEALCASSSSFLVATWTSLGVLSRLGHGPDCYLGP